MAYSTISKPILHFNTKLYTGNGGTNAITGVGFQPDWLWLKKRNSSANHFLFDAVRGASKELNSNNSEAEASPANYLSSFDSDGFTIGSDSDINGNSDTHVAWNWKANGSGSANTDGSISSTVSANTTAGFSIVKFTGSGANATVGHGLGVAPKMYLLKSLGDTSAWLMYHDGLDASSPQNYRLVLNQNTARQDNTTWNDTAPTSSVFSVGSASEVNGSGVDRIVYCFAEKKGYSKFGSYVGNGNADGTFIYTGFAPSFVIMKRTDGSGSWYTLDNKRPTYNPKDKYLSPDSSNAESTFTFWDFLSNGFKIRNTGTENNASGGNYIYMAFAEEPLVANVGASIPATAR